MATLQFIGLVNEGAHDLNGRYLVSYDPEYHLPDGSYDGGSIESTADRSQAKVFPDKFEAFTVWRSGPTCLCHRLRADGLPIGR